MATLLLGMLADSKNTGNLVLAAFVILVANTRGKSNIGVEIYIIIVKLIMRCILHKIEWNGIFATDYF